jgi:hypothetical protein
MQKMPDAPRLALARDEFLIVVKRDQPPLTAKRTHLAHLIDVDPRIPMDSPEARMPQALVEILQGLRRQVLTPRGYDPHQIALRLKCQDLRQTQQEILPSGLPNNLSRCRGGADPVIPAGAPFFPPLVCRKSASRVR